MAPSAPTVVTGNRLTGVGIQQARRIVEMQERIYQYDPQVTPFLSILAQRAPAQVSGNPKFQHLEDQPLPFTTTLNGSINATVTTVNVSAGTGLYFRAGDVLLAPTAASIAAPGEIMYVSSVATDALTVIRNYNGDGVNGGSVSSGANLRIVGNTNAEFAGARTVKTTTEALVSNYCQIIRSPFALSNTLEASNLYGGNDRTYQRAKAATQHALECERACLFGKPAETLATGTRTTGGFLYWVTSNVVNASGTLTPATLETFCEKIFRYGSSSKLFMVSRRIASQLDLIAEGRIETAVGVDAYGVAVKNYKTTHGQLMVAIHDQLVDDFAGYGLAVDMENVKLRYMQGRQGARHGLLRTEIQNNDADGVEDEYLSEIGLHVMLESTHGILSGVS